MSTYYVKNGGSDAASGLSDALAWETIAKVNGSSFNAGDSILFKRDSTWREQLTVPSSGSAGLPITFGAYGTGADPIISGADLVTGWTQYAPAGAAQDTQDLSDANGALGYDRYQAKLAQKITPASSYAIQKVSVWMNRYNSPSGNVWIEIWSSSGGNPNALITNGTSDTVSAGGISTTAALVDFNFTTPPSLLSGTVYFVVVTRDYGDSTSNYIKVYNYAAGNYAGGTYWEWDSGGPTWTDKTPRDMRFTVYSTGASTNIYSASCDWAAKEVFEDGTRLTAIAWDTNIATTSAAMSAGTWTLDTGGDLVYVWAADEADPDTHAMEVTTRDRCVDGSGKDHITLDGLDLEQSNSHGLYSGDSTSVVLSNCEIAYCYATGIYMSGSGGGENTGHSYLSNHIHHNGSTGISNVTYGGDCTVRYNSVHDNCWDTTDNTTAGIKFYSGPFGSEDPDNNAGHTIEYNHVYSNGVASGVRGAGIWCDYSNANTIRFNRIHDNLGPGGVHVEKSSNCVVTYNIVYGELADHGPSVGRGITMSMDDGSADVSDNLIYNNTVYNCRELFVMYGAGSTKNISNNLIKNNIFLGGVDNDFFIYTQGRASGNAFSYNCLGAEPIDVDWEGAAKTTYAAWETAYGGTTHSVEADPLFTNAAGGDFTLQAGSPCIDAGVDLGTDYQMALAPGSTWP